MLTYFPLEEKHVSIFHFVYCNCEHTLASADVDTSLQQLVFSQDAGKHCIDIAELAIDVEGRCHLFRRETGFDLGIVFDELAVVLFVLPGVHSMRLHETIGVFAGHAGSREVDE